MGKRVVIILFLVAGIFGLYATAVFYESTTIFLKTAEMSESVVVELVPPTEEGKTKHAALFEFTDIRGYVYEVLSESTQEPSYTLSEKVMLIYNPKAPEKAQVYSFFQVWKKSIIFGITSLLVTLFCIASLLVGNRG